MVMNCATMSLLLLAGVVPREAGASGYLRPETVSFSELVSKDFVDQPRIQVALSRQGIIAVEMGTDFGELRASVLADVPRCLDALHTKGAAVATVNLPDGTTRRTLASESNVDGRKKLNAIFPTASAPKECSQFEVGSNKFRRIVGEVVDAFGDRLAQVVQSLSTRFHVPELKYHIGSNTSSIEDHRPFAELTRRGPRLEHFHEYQGDEGFAASQMRLSSQTIDFHADQGLFVVFSPGMMFPLIGSAASSAASGHFTVRSADREGNIVARDLEMGPDAGSKLVILLGDALRQLGIPHVERLFHVPSHAFRMPADSSSAHLRRLWYGLMQLPPPALVAQEVVDQVTQQKLTFGEIRSRVAASTGAEEGLALGCSPLAQQLGGSGIARRLVPRLLEDAATCESGSIYCWHRCMEVPADMTEEQCSAQGEGFRFACISQFGQVYRAEDGHGDYWPNCTSATENVTPRPPVEQPSAESVASNETWAARTTLGVGNEAFTHKITLDQGVGNTALLWTLDSSGDTTYLHAKMLHRGHVGWMAIGLENICGHHNGMNGGETVMGMNFLPEQFQVGEHKIHETDSAFRHWQTPLAESSLVESSFSIKGGISILEFKTASIYNVPLNLSAPGQSGNAINRFIWGLTGNAYCTEEYGGYCAYHASADSDRSRREEFRGHVRLDLASGEVLAREGEKCDDHDEASTDDHGDSSTTTATKMMGDDVSAGRVAASLASVSLVLLLVLQ